MSDFDTIRKALKTLRTLARAFRYGGLGCAYELAQRALEALDRIEKPRLV